eukprot:m.98297 g.98297  ORF g.98297 m.98297 type:complete len:424 (-) comp12516_c1_seq2:2637-3908(-)
MEMEKSKRTKKKKDNPYKRGQNPSSVVSTKKPKPMKDLHGYFGGQNTTVPTYFLIDFPHSALFLRTIPKDKKVFFVRNTIKWHGKDLNLCSLNPLIEQQQEQQQEKQQQQDHHLLDDEKRMRNKHSVLTSVYASNPKYKQLLQSHLQKCIRRCEAAKAASTAKEMVLTHCNALLRRLPIITLEDAVLHEKFPLLVWMMAAESKGVQLPESMKAFVVAYARSVAECRTKEPMMENHGEGEGDDNERKGKKANAKFDMKQIPKQFEGNPELSCYLYAMQLRRSFGGMGCDMKMLDHATWKWAKRLKTNRCCSPHSSKSMFPMTPLREVPSLRKQDWVLAAVDFHCTDIDQRIHRLHPSLGVDQIRRIIWEFRSSVNSKKLFEEGNNDREREQQPQLSVANEDDSRVWTLIKKDLDVLSTEILSES